MNENQQKAFLAVQRGQHVFITGEAGTGKSFTINKIVQWLKTTRKPFGLTALTGTAAVTIQGRTLHSFLGLGLGTKSATDLTLYAKAKNKPLVKKLQALKTLIIDEISMLSDKLFLVIHEYLQNLRQNTEPFGGVQLVLCGDMAQLPPINADFVFVTDLWKSLNITTVMLTQMIRQEHGSALANMLSELRWGICSDSTLEQLQVLKNPFFGEIQPTILYSKNINVDSINVDNYRKLIKDGATEKIYTTSYSPDKYTSTWASSLNIPEEVRLCVGAQVILTFNLSVEDGLCNGSRGMITGFDGDGPIVLFKKGDQIIIEDRTIENEENSKMWVRYCPLKLAWALTIHKSQSMTLDAAVLDIGPSIFEYGQAYTALSRIRNVESVKIINVSKEAFKTHPDVLQFYGKKEMDRCLNCNGEVYYSQNQECNKCKFLKNV